MISKYASSKDGAWTWILDSLESNGKKRAQVLSAIKVRLDKHSNEVQQNLSKEIVMANDRGTYNNIDNENISEIEETDELTVTVPIDK